MKKGYTIPELVIVLAIFTIVYVVATVSVSHAFTYDPIESTYESRINLIKIQAKNYAINNANLFEKENTIVIYAKDLIENGYYATNANGDIEDPRDETKTLNDIKIEIKKDNDTYDINIM